MLKFGHSLESRYQNIKKLNTDYCTLLQILPLFTFRRRPSVTRIRCDENLLKIDLYIQLLTPA